MRARQLKPEFFKDRKMGSLGLAAAIVYAALWCMSDDGGVAKGTAEEIKGEMLVWWEELDVPAIRTALTKLEEAKRITGYMIGDDQFWTLHTLLRHQGKIHKPSAFRHPRPSVSSAEPVPEYSGSENAKPLTDKELPLSAGVVPEYSGTPRNLYTSTPVLPYTSTPTAADGKSMADVLTVKLNQGLLDNPAIGERAHTIPHGHAPSLTAAGEIAKAGVPAEFAAQYVYAAAKKYKPTERNRQINSLAYLADGVITAWEKEQARANANGASRPAGKPVTPNIPPWKRDDHDRGLNNQPEVMAVVAEARRVRGDEWWHSVKNEAKAAGRWAAPYAYEKLQSEAANV